MNTSGVKKIRKSVFRFLKNSSTVVFSKTNRCKVLKFYLVRPLYETPIMCQFQESSLSISGRKCKIKNKMFHFFPFLRVRLPGWLPNVVFRLFRARVVGVGSW